MDDLAAGIVGAAAMVDGSLHVLRKVGGTGIIQKLPLNPNATVIGNSADNTTRAIENIARTGL